MWAVPLRCALWCAVQWCAVHCGVHCALWCALWCAVPLQPQHTCTPQVAKGMISLTLALCVHVHASVCVCMHVCECMHANHVSAAAVEVKRGERHHIPGVRVTAAVGCRM